MAKFGGLLLVSDIDGTLIGGAPKVSDANAQKINYFIENGGYFTIATGRCVDACRELLKSVNLSAPAAMVNGTVIYDYAAEQVVTSRGMDDEIKNIVCEIAKRKNPLIGIEIHSREKVIDVAITREVDIHNLYEDLHPLIMTIDEALDYEWNKVLFTFEEGYTNVDLREDLLALGAKENQLMFTNAHLDDGIHNYLEVVPAGADKGTGIKLLADSLGIDIKNVYGIGDFYNDIPMLKTVGCAAVVAGAPQEIIEMADFVSSTVEEGAVGRFIDYIEERMQNDEN
ncbi:MAG: HAD-IIB family hydrolase [Clostridia bacterium]|nr:HAD-IIB family hydrolase [Clostridia bacterium]